MGWSVTLPKRWSRQDDFDGAVTLAAGKYGVPPALVKATIGVESGFNPSAVNKSDPGWAWGLMQMLPATASGLGFNGDMQSLLVNPNLAIDLGTMLLGQNLRRTGGVVADSVSAYNGGFRPSLGLGAVRPNGTYANQDYVNRVLDALNYFAAYEASKVPPPAIVQTGTASVSEEGGGGSVPLPFRPGSGNIPPPRSIRWSVPLTAVLGGSALWLMLWAAFCR